MLPSPPGNRRSRTRDKKSRTGVLVFRGIHESQKLAAELGNAWGFSLFFAVLAVNYQRATSRSWRKSWVLDGTASERTAKRPLFFCCFPLFLESDAVKTRVALPVTVLNASIDEIRMTSGISQDSVLSI